MLCVYMYLKIKGLFASFFSEITVRFDVFSRQHGCQIQGFNSINKDYDYDTGAKTRIGIIGTPVKCYHSMQSRIGFGSAGSFYAMDDSNSCGNELRYEVSIEAFGYIFVQ